jgi:hypothetical protein
LLPGISRPGISRDPAGISFPESREKRIRDPGKFLLNKVQKIADYEGVLCIYFM